MPTIKNGTLLYTAHPAPHAPLVPGTHMRYVEEDLDLEAVPLNGGVLVKVFALSADPYMRYRMRDPSEPSFAPVMPLGTPVDNTGVGKVLRSEDPNFKPGDYVVAFLDYKEYAIYPSPAHPPHLLQSITKVTRTPGLPLAHYVGVLGTAGRTAYGGFRAFALEKAETSKTMFVSGAAGPVGTFLIQYAKHLFPHLKIVASAGSRAKLDILRAVGADVVVNYKEDDVGAALAQHGPIDIYWDNVAGPTLDAALTHMATDGLIIACGAISAANNNGTGSPVMNFEQIFQRNITVRGFLLSHAAVLRALATFEAEVVPLVLDGTITVREHRYSLREAGEAVAGLHEGRNVGKAVVWVADEE